MRCRERDRKNSENREVEQKYVTGDKNSKIKMK
jgi:hypothetical protein